MTSSRNNDVINDDKNLTVNVNLDFSNTGKISLKNIKYFKSYRKKIDRGGPRWWWPDDDLVSRSNNNVNKNNYYDIDVQGIWKKAQRY